MAFSDYKSIAQVQQEYGITYCEINFINAKPRDPTPQFLIELAFNLDNIDVYTSEGARSEIDYWTSVKRDLQTLLSRIFFMDKKIYHL